MFQSFAIFMILVAAAQAEQQYASNADAAAELQATETSATPFGHKQLTRCRQSCYLQVGKPPGQAIKDKTHLMDTSTALD